MLDKPIPMKLTKLNIVRACSVFGHAVGSKQISLSKYSGEGCEVQLVTCLCKKKNNTYRLCMCMVPEQA